MVKEFTIVVLLSLFAIYLVAFYSPPPTAMARTPEDRTPEDMEVYSVNLPFVSTLEDRTPEDRTPEDSKTIVFVGCDGYMTATEIKLTNCQTVSYVSEIDNPSLGQRLVFLEEQMKKIGFLVGKLRFQHKETINHPPVPGGGSGP